ncbi:MAG: prepilin peptidase [Clostridiaceae bacterium]|nr:prepilin peptidase [Clostridiaceae bacterium]
MYINDINIIFYILIGILGLIVGQFIDWCNIRLPEYKKVFSKEFFTIYMKNFKPKYFLIITTALLYIAILYFVGWKPNMLYQLKLVKYLVLAPMLLSALIIDWKLQIIPNRLNLTIFEVGLAFTFAQGICNINVGIDMLLGAVVGAGIFLIITLLGGIIAGKEAMGFGDVKFMGALGLFFGWVNIIIISLISFLLAAVISIILLTTKKKKTDEYIPFGPFIVLATFIVMLVPSNILLFGLFKIFTLGMYQGSI